jgi:hypothetical protein
VLARVPFVGTLCPDLPVVPHPASGTARATLLLTMDPLRRHDIELARMTPLSTKAAQALDAMRLGIELKWAALKHRHPTETDAEIEARVRRWLSGEPEVD